MTTVLSLIPAKNIHKMVPAPILQAIGAIIFGGASVFIIEHIRHKRAMAYEADYKNNMMYAMQCQLDELLAWKADEELGKNKKPTNSISTTATLAEIDQGLDSDNLYVIQKTLLAIQNLLERRGESADLLWREAKGYRQLVKITLDVGEKKKYIRKVLVALRSEFRPFKDQISDGHLFMQHIDIAIKLNPEDASLHHLLGRFAYEAARSTWFERGVAAALYNEVLSTTYPEALQHFLTAEELPNNKQKENRLWIGNCLIATSEYKDALTWLQKAKNVKCEDNNDKQLDVEIEKLISKYNRYT